MSHRVENYRAYSNMWGTLNSRDSSIVHYNFNIWCTDLSFVPVKRCILAEFRPTLRNRFDGRGILKCGRSLPQIDVNFRCYQFIWRPFRLRSLCLCRELILVCSSKKWLAFDLLCRAAWVVFNQTRLGLAIVANAFKSFVGIPPLPCTEKSPRNGSTVAGNVERKAPASYNPVINWSVLRRRMEIASETAAARAANSTEENCWGWSGGNTS